MGEGDRRQSPDAAPGREGRFSFNWLRQDPATNAECECEAHDGLAIVASAPPARCADSEGSEVAFAVLLRILAGSASFTR